MSLCQFVSKTQKTGEKFCISMQNEDCVGKMVLGMEPISPIGASGQAGFDFGVFKSQAPNARLYHLIPRMIPGTVNYVTFSPVAICDFDPDLVIFVANTKTADIIMKHWGDMAAELDSTFSLPENK